MESLKPLVDEWLSLDKNASTRQEIQSLWDEGNVDELERRMRPRIQFGTAGLRGKMEAGWARMNDLIVLQAAQGLRTYVLEMVPRARTLGVVIGHDHRHNSSRWAKLTAAVFMAQGIKVHWYNDLVPTPMVPFGVVRLPAACGVMVTASHNPKQDNGYKVYWADGVQISGHHAEGIAAAIQAQSEGEIWDDSNVLSSNLCVDCTDSMTRLYYIRLQHLNVSRLHAESFHLKIVNTSMHGVSHRWVADAFDQFGFDPFIPVQEQKDPDPDFPTVQYPNPEEKGALDLAIQTANREGASYVFAQDPDADRFIAAERRSDGSWYTFTGDELGTLFAAWTLRFRQPSRKPIAMVASTVSSKMVAAIARANGFRFVECLTGFKHIGATALALEEDGYEVPFAYEEAIGYMFGSDIKDKDGVAATLAFAELVRSLHRLGMNVRSFLAELYDRYGYYRTSNSYFRCDCRPTIDKIFSRLREFPREDPTPFPCYPATIAGLPIRRVIDLTIGYDTINPPTFRPSLPLSDGQMIQIRAGYREGPSMVLTVRTSGTEPKIKYYLEVFSRETALVNEILPEAIEELEEDWLEVSKHGLRRPSD